MSHSAPPPDWTQVKILLPISNAKENIAAKRCLALLSRICEGYIVSKTAPHVYEGYYRNSNPGIPVRWLHEKICLVTVDIDVPVNDPRFLILIHDYQMRASALYDAESVPQGELWITAAAVYKISSLASVQNALAQSP